MMRTEPRLNKERMTDAHLAAALSGLRVEDDARAPAPTPTGPLIKASQVLNGAFVCVCVDPERCGGDGQMVVYTAADTHVPAWTILGELEGTPRDISELYHTDYVVLTETWVLDVRLDYGERSVLTWVAEDNDTYAPPNCRIVRDLATQQFFLQTTVPIGANTELVYSIEWFSEEYLTEV